MPKNTRAANVQRFFLVEGSDFLWYLNESAHDNTLVTGSLVWQPGLITPVDTFSEVEHLGEVASMSPQITTAIRSTTAFSHLHSYCNWCTAVHDAEEKVLCSK